jgi:hypothetical protein
MLDDARSQGRRCPRRSELEMQVKQYDLSTRQGRYAARKAGIDVPKRRAGRKPRPIEELLAQEGDCLVWTGSVDICGYGRYSNGGSHMAHRWVFAQAHGPIPAGLVVRHSCDNPRCCSLDHLSLGTQADNVRDRQKRGRGAKGARLASAKLTEQQVSAMRHLYAAGGLRYEDLAKQYGVSRDAAQKAIRGITWGHVG